MLCTADISDHLSTPSSRLSASSLKSSGSDIFTFPIDSSIFSDFGSILEIGFTGTMSCCSISLHTA